MRKARREITLKTRFEILSRDGFACGYCGAKAPQAVLHVDHVVPLALGGSGQQGNLITSCESCNLGKGIGVAVGVVVPIVSHAKCVTCKAAFIPAAKNQAKCVDCAHPKCGHPDCEARERHRKMERVGKYFCKTHVPSRITLCACGKRKGIGGVCWACKRKRPCMGCGSLSNGVRCRSCAMKDAWKRPEYKWSVGAKRKKKLCACGAWLGQRNRSGKCASCWSGHVPAG